MSFLRQSHVEFPFGEQRRRITTPESQFVIEQPQPGPTLYGNHFRGHLAFTLARHLVYPRNSSGPARGNSCDHTAGAFFQHQTQHLFQYETVPGFASWSELPAPARPSPIQSRAHHLGDFVQFYKWRHFVRALCLQLTPISPISNYLDFRPCAVYGELTRHLTTADGRCAHVLAELHKARIPPFRWQPHFSTLPLPGQPHRCAGFNPSSRENSRSAIICSS